MRESTIPCSPAASAPDGDIEEASVPPCSLPAGPCRDRARSLPGLSHGPHRAAVLLAALIVLAVPCTRASAAVPAGVWLIEGKAAVQIFDCSGQLCGRILWLLTPRDPQGRLN